MQKSTSSAFETRTSQIDSIRQTEKAKINKLDEQKDHTWSEVNPVQISFL